MFRSLDVVTVATMGKSEDGSQLLELVDGGHDGQRFERRPGFQVPQFFVGAQQVEHVHDSIIR
jgi:hypothetical protein